MVVFCRCSVAPGKFGQTPGLGESEIPDAAATLLRQGRDSLNTLAAVSMTCTRSRGGSLPSFRAMQDFAIVASFVTPTVEGSLKPAPRQSDRIASVAVRAGWLVMGTTRDRKSV